MAKVESFVFYTSWLESIEELENDTDKLNSLLAIMRYQAYHEETDVKGVAKAIFVMAKPVADELYSRRQASASNGKKGGRPKSTQSEETEDKVDGNKNLKKPRHNLEKPKPNLYENENDNENDNDNVNFSKEFTDALANFKEMRKKIKKPLTDKATEMILTKLSKLAIDEETQIEILNQSTMNCWQGVYPLETQKSVSKEKKGLEALMDL